jgi:hypothetical protein
VISSKIKNLKHVDQALGGRKTIEPDPIDQTIQGRLPDGPTGIFCRSGQTIDMIKIDTTILLPTRPDPQQFLTVLQRASTELPS